MCGKITFHFVSSASRGTAWLLHFSLLHRPMWIIDIKPYKNFFLQVTNKWSCIEQNCLDIQTMHKVLSYIEWISGGQTSVIVQSNSIKVYSNRPIEVDSLTAQADCVRAATFGTDSTTPAVTGVERSFGITPVAGRVGGVVFIGIMHTCSNCTSTGTKM